MRKGEGQEGNGTGREGDSEKAPATVGKIPNFLAFEEKTVRGTLIGSMKDMEKVIEIAQKNNFKVVTESFPLEQANEVLERLKNSDIEARAVLIP